MSKASIAALQWYLDHGVDETLEDSPADRVAPPAAIVAAPLPPTAAALPSSPLIGTHEAQREAVRLAAAAKTLDDLQAAIRDFEAVAIKKTATNLVFSDGNPAAPVMLVGEAPGADEDRQGKPFVGVSGQLLDRILACIDLARGQDDPARAVYIANILNWRPPGNRTPSPAEIALSLPFIERHIQLIKPKILILCGGVSAKALLGREESISRLRKGWQTYTLQTSGLEAGHQDIPALCTYHPAYLLRTPSQKRAVWADMLAVQEKRRALGLLST